MYRLFIVVFFAVVLNGKILNVYLQTDGVQYRTYMTRVTNEFKKLYPNIDVKIKCHKNEIYKKNITKFLNDESIDILNWQGGERLFDHVKKNKIDSLKTLWEQNDFDKRFGYLKETVFYKNTPYAVPISYYQWGFYYNKKLFENLNLQVPKTWEEFLKVCEVLKQNDITPIVLGAKNKWTAASWFDYINLRVNGIKFHKNLLKGKVSYKSEKVVKVFKIWKELLSKDYFTKNSKNWTWNQPLPYILRQKAGMMLIGNFVTTNITKFRKKEIGFFGFPIIDSSIGRYEESPVDIFMVNKSSKNIKEAKEFIKFISKKDIQESLNEGLSLIPAHKSAKVQDKNFLKEGKSLISTAKGITQYFDLDTPYSFSSKALVVLANFIDEPNIDKTTSQLEELRKKEY